MTWTKLTSSDAGAPSLKAAAGSLATVFRWALPLLGFSLVYGPTGNAAVFRATTGNRYYFHVNNTDAGTYGTSIVRGAQTATSATALGNAFPTTAQSNNNVSRWNAGDYANPTLATPYVFYSDGKFFYFLCQRAAGDVNSWALHFFGDVPTQYATTWATVIGVTDSQYPNAAIAGIVGYGYPSAETNIFWARGINTTTKPTRGNLYSVGGFCAVSNSPQTRAGYLNRIVRQKVGVHCSGQINTGMSPSNLAITARGWLPNLWNPIHSSWTGSPASLDTFTDTAYNPAATFCWYAHTSSAGFIIEESDTWTKPTS